MRIGNAASADELFDLVLEAAHEAVTYESASLMTVDAAGDALIIRAARPGRLVGTRVGVGPSISWQALERSQECGGGQVAGCSTRPFRTA